MHADPLSSRGRLLPVRNGKTQEKPTKRLLFWSLIGGMALGLLCLQVGLLQDVFGDPGTARVFEGAVVLICAGVLLGTIHRARLG
jgi:preprotein translocase subunit SecY